MTSKNNFLQLCVSCRTIGLPRFNGLRSKLAKIALFIYLISYWVECMMSSVILFAYFTHFSSLNITRTNADIYKRCFYPFMEYYVIHLRNQGVKNLIIVPLQKFCIKTCKRLNNDFRLTRFAFVVRQKFEAAPHEQKQIANPSNTRSVLDLHILVFSRLIYGPHASQKTLLRTSDSVSKGCIIH